MLYLLAPYAVREPALASLARSNACVTLDWGVVCSRSGYVSDGAAERRASAKPAMTALKPDSQSPTVKPGGQ